MVHGEKRGKNMSFEPKIGFVDGNKEKQLTYAEQKKRYSLAMKYGFYYEAILIDYALLEDRLKAILYHMGIIAERTDDKIWSKSKPFVKKVVSDAMGEEDAKRLGIRNITAKSKIIKSIIKWVSEEESQETEKRFAVLRKQCESLDAALLLDTLEKIDEWCKWRNEIIHGLMHKKADLVEGVVPKLAASGMEYVTILDAQERIIKKGNQIRKSSHLRIDK